MNMKLFNIFLKLKMRNFSITLHLSLEKNWGRNQDYSNDYWDNIYQNSTSNLFDFEYLKKTRIKLCLLNSFNNVRLEKQLELLEKRLRTDISSTSLNPKSEKFY